MSNKRAILALVFYLSAAASETELQVGALKSRFPFELDMDIGFVWIYQARATWNINEFMCVKARFSSIALVHECSVITGLQCPLDHNKKLQLGAGYSRLINPGVFFSGKIKDPDNPTLELNFIHYIYEIIGYNIGVNVIFNNDVKVLPSINAGLILGIGPSKFFSQ